MYPFGRTEKEFKKGWTDLSEEEINKLWEQYKTVYDITESEPTTPAKSEPITQEELIELLREVIRSEEGQAVIFEELNKITQILNDPKYNSPPN